MQERTTHGVGAEGPQKSGLLVESAQMVVLIQSHCVIDIIRFVRNEKMIDDETKKCSPLLLPLRTHQGILFRRNLVIVL